MGNCLVKKLKGTVQNDNLPIYGMAKVYAKAGSSFNIKTTPNSTILIKGGTLDGETEFVTNAEGWLVHNNNIVSDGTYGEDIIQVIVPKYGIIRVSTFSMDANDVEYSEGLSILGAKNIINANKLEKIFKFESLTNVQLNNARLDVAVDISELGSNGVLTEALIGGNGINMIGSANKLGMSPLTSVVFPGTKNVTFSVETFVAYNRSAGRTTGSLDLGWVGGCNSTFNGQPIAVVKQNNLLSWDATTITLDGVTINA